MSVLIIKNIANEGPGTIEEYLLSERRSCSTVDMHKGEVPPPLKDFEHVVVLGGPMAVYDMHRYPFLKDEAKLIEQAIKAEKHVLGVCLGAQMIAHVLGARVYAGSQKEIGWSEVNLTPEGKEDKLMATLSADGGGRAKVFQLHGDTFDLPSETVRLASSEPFPNQAFRYADRIYALQFHIEVTPGVVFGWLRQEIGIDLNAVDAESNRIYRPYRTRAMNFYRGFFKI